MRCPVRAALPLQRVTKPRADGGPYAAAHLGADADADAPAKPAAAKPAAKPAPKKNVVPTTPAPPGFKYDSFGTLIVNGN